MVMSQWQSRIDDLTGPDEVVKLKKQIKNMIDIAHKHIFPDKKRKQVKDYFGIKTTSRNQYTVEQMNK
jgi:chromosome condensin MukBEF complex kleisin-like MukF subunit